VSLEQGASPKVDESPLARRSAAYERRTVRTPLRLRSPGDFTAPGVSSRFFQRILLAGRGSVVPTRSCSRRIAFGTTDNWKLSTPHFGSTAGIEGNSNKYLAVLCPPPPV